MLAASAYSFRQQSRLAISLSWIGGYVNVVALLATAHVVSHTTGNATSLAQSIALGHAGQVALLAGLLGCFLLGAMISAIMTETARGSRGHANYMLAVATEAAVLLTVAILLHVHRYAGEDSSVIESSASQQNLALAVGCLGSLAMGLQNATITRISGSVVRTTHLTGVFTDLGIELVRLARWVMGRMRSAQPLRSARLMRVTMRQQAFLRVALLASIIGSFCFGALVGTWLYANIPAWTMYLPVAFLLLIVVIDWRKPIADVRMLDPLHIDDEQLKTMLRDLLPAQVGIYRLLIHGSSHHRAPDFQQWAANLPEHWEVVILMLSPMTVLDTNAAVDLRLAIEKLRGRGRHVVLANLTARQARTLMQAGAGQVLPRMNVCSDLPAAISRAMAIHGQLKQMKRTDDQDESTRSPHA